MNSADRPTPAVAPGAPRVDFYNLMCLPWTVERLPSDEDGTMYVRVKEMPETIAHGMTGKELSRAFWDALMASLDARVQWGDPIPLPAGYEMVLTPRRIHPRGTP